MGETYNRMHQQNLDMELSNNTESSTTCNEELLLEMIKNRNNTESSTTYNKELLLQIIKDIMTPNEKVITHLENYRNLWKCNFLILVIEFIIFCIYYSPNDSLLFWMRIDFIIHFFQMIERLSFRSPRQYILDNLSILLNQNVNDCIIKYFRLWRHIIMNNIINFIHLCWSAWGMSCIALYGLNDQQIIGVLVASCIIYSLNTLLHSLYVITF